MRWIGGLTGGTRRGNDVGPLELPPSLVSYASMTTVSVETKYFPSSGASLPALALQVTCLADSYMLWIGATEEPEEKADHAALRGHLGKDWAVAMPPWNVRTHRMEEHHETLFLYV